MSDMPIYFYALGRLEERVDFTARESNSVVAKDFVASYYKKYGFGRSLNDVWDEYAEELHEYSDAVPHVYKPPVGLCVNCGSPKSMGNHTDYLEDK